MGLKFDLKLESSDLKTGIILAILSSVGKIPSKIQLLKQSVNGMQHSFATFCNILVGMDPLVDFEGFNSIIAW